MEYPFWTYKRYTGEELEEVDKWLRGPANKEIILSDNLWDNIDKLSSKYGVHTHPVFAHKDQYIKMAMKDLELKKLADEQAKTDASIRGRPGKEERELSANQYLRKLTYLLINNYKVDAITLKFIFYSLKHTKIDTIKFASTCLTNQEFEIVVEYMQDYQHKIRRVFFDWNFHSDFDEKNLSKLGTCKKLDFLMIRGCKMTDSTFENLLKEMKENSVQLKVLDLYANCLTDNSVHFLSEFIGDYRHIESFGFGGNKISNITSFNNFFIQCGRIEINQQDFQKLQAQHRSREKVIEKNNKLRTLKKPEEQVPYVDPIEHDQAAGKYYQFCYKNLKYINLVGNRMKIEAEDLDYLCMFLEKMKHSVVILSVNQVGERVEERLLEFSDQVLL